MRHPALPVPPALQPFWDWTNGLGYGTFNQGTSRSKTTAAACGLRQHCVAVRHALSLALPGMAAAGLASVHRLLPPAP